MNRPGSVQSRAVFVIAASLVAVVTLLCPEVARCDRYVRPDGVDSGDCSSPAAPCATLGYAVDNAVSGELVRVARGIYSSGADVGSTSLTIQGGWSRDFTWCHPDPSLTVLDGSGISCASWGGYFLTIEGLTIQNASVGVRAINECATSLESVVLRGNGTGLSVGSALNVYASVRNSMVVGNVRGIAAYATGQVATITLSLNSSTLTGNGTGIDFAASGMPNWFVTLEGTVKNSIIYGNDVVDVEVGGSGFATCTLRASYSDIGVLGLGAGSPCTYLPEAGLIDQDPGFVGPGDYHLEPSSACVDVGDPASTSTHDIDQEPRPFDGDGNGVAIGDMGADEYWDRPTGPVVFWDDLESGTTDAWGSVVP